MTLKEVNTYIFLEVEWYVILHAVQNINELYHNSKFLKLLPTPPMVEERKDEGAGDPIKILFKEALKKQRNVMMEYFA